MSCGVGNRRKKQWCRASFLGRKMAGRPEMLMQECSHFRCWFTPVPYGLHVRRDGVRLLRLRPVP